jgi:Hsp70 protein
MWEPDAYCKRCRIWSMLDGDLFCSWCGYEVTQLLVRDRPIRLYVEREQPTTLRAPILTNLSPVPVSVQPVGQLEWLDVIFPASVVKPGEELSVTLDVDADKLEAIPKGDELVFQPTAAGGVSFKEVKVGVKAWWAPPEVTISPLTAFTGRGSAKSNLEITTTTEISIESLTFQPPYLSLDRPTPVEVIQLDTPTPLPVQLNLPEQQGSQAQTIAYELRVEGYPKPLAGTFELTVKKSATMRVEASGSELTREIIPDFEEALAITVTNAGEEVLEIDGISVAARDPRSRIAVRPDKERFSVEPGKQATIKLRALAEPGVPSGSHFFTASFQSNDPVADHKQVPLNLRVVDETHPTYIAFDFGTTDSAVAHFVMNELKPVTLDLEGVGDPKIYSNIFFREYDEQSDPPHKWAIGALAKELGRLNREQFVRAVKTKVGASEPVKIDFKDLGVSCTLPPEQIAQYIMKDLLRLTRQALRKKPAYVILSVPTRFTKRRSMLLKGAFEQAAQSLSLNLVKVETIDESLAAGLFYIIRRGPNDEMVKRKSNYTMMILDFGGGTTDITVFKVRQHLGPGGDAQRIEEVEIIGAWGDATLGGEEVTTDIAELLAERFLGRRLDRRHDAPHVKNLEGTAEAVKLAVSDLLRLGRLDDEEEFECAISDPNLPLRASLSYLETKTYDEAALRAFVDSYQSRGNQLQVAFAAAFPGRTVSISEDDVVAIYERKLRKLKYEVDLMMCRIAARQEPRPGGAAGPPKVDVLLLAGQSSRFPTVKEIFQDLAVQPPDFVRNEAGKLVLKECVSMGALYWKWGGRNPRFKIKGRDRLWHWIGDIDPDALGSPTFREFVPWGCEYPHVSGEIRNTDVEGDKVVLEVYENLSMNSEPKLEVYRKFGLPVAPPVKDEYPCRLLVNEFGEVEAECKVKGRWERMS